MAQFSALEQMQNLNTSFSATKAFGMIGKYITATMLNESTFETEAVAAPLKVLRWKAAELIWLSEVKMFRLKRC